MLATAASMVLLSNCSTTVLRTGHTAVGGGLNPLFSSGEGALFGDEL
jgi:hypothetical protein